MGANTMGCLVDGQAFELISAGFNTTPLGVTRFQRRSRMLFYFRQQSGKLNRTILLSIPYLRSPGRYVLDQVADPSFTLIAPAYGNFQSSNPEPSRDYLTSPVATGHVLITRFDSVAHIISGTFEFTAQKTSGEGPETVRLTDGRFDLRYPQ